MPSGSTLYLEAGVLSAPALSYDQKGRAAGGAAELGRGSRRASARRLAKRARSGFARFNASAPLAASTAEGPGEPVRHRYNPGGNRRVNRVLHLMAITQLRCEPRAQALYDNARKRGHTKKEARRILKRHLSDVIYRHMIRDLASHPAQPLLAA
jgi:hypothetical protein